MTEARSPRYEKSAAKQRAWWNNMTEAEREEYLRKKRAGMKRYQNGKRKASTCG